MSNDIRRIRPMTAADERAVKDARRWYAAAVRVKHRLATAERQAAAEISTTVAWVGRQNRDAREQGLPEPFPRPATIARAATPVGDASGMSDGELAKRLKLLKAEKLLWEMGSDAIKWEKDREERLTALEAEADRRVLATSGSKP